MAMGILDEIAKVIASINYDTPTGQPEFLTYLASALHDKSHELTLDLFHKMRETGITPSALAFNYFL